MSRRFAHASTLLAASLLLTACVSVTQQPTTTGPLASPSTQSTPRQSSPPVQATSSTPGIAESPGRTQSALAPTPGVPSSGVVGPTIGSLAYVKDGNVWISAPDGSRARQLTTDALQGAYHDPSQAADGTIYALRGTDEMVALDRSTGAPKAASVTLITLENGAEGLTVSPDGSHVAYTTTGFGQEIDPRFGTPVGGFIYGGTDIATLDGKSVPDAAMATVTFPSWDDSATIVVGDGVRIYRGSIGSPPPLWLDESNGCLLETDCQANEGAAADLSEPVTSRDGALLAYIFKPYFGPTGRVLARVIGGVPQWPKDACILSGHQNYSDPGSFAPDSSAFAFDDTSFDPTTFETTVGQGIYVLNVNVDASDCGLSTATLIARGGAQPDWGPLAP